MAGVGVRYRVTEDPLATDSITYQAGITEWDYDPEERVEDGKMEYGLWISQDNGDSPTAELYAAGSLGRFRPREDAEKIAELQLPEKFELSEGWEDPWHRT